MAKPSNGKAAAFDASIYTEESTTEEPLRLVKTRSAVDHLEKQLELAEEAVDRLEGKRDKVRAHADDVDNQIEEAIVARDGLQEELESARRQLEELEVGS